MSMSFSMIRAVPVLAAIFAFVGIGPALGDQNITAKRIDKAPVVDGQGNDPSWADAPQVTLHDPVAKIDIALKAVHTGEEVFILTTFPDATENRDHKTMIWDDATKVYRTGPRREDTVVLKWSMATNLVDLTLSSNEPYKADIWYWKANRTDHAGYADDKFQTYSNRRLGKAKKMLSKSGKVFYLLRSGDEGDAAYSVSVIPDFQGPETPRFSYRAPSGSRADIRAKGFWRDGRWTVEFGRKMFTGHADDIQFEIGGSYRFGVSRFEIAGRKPDPRLDEPLFGSGEIDEVLTLSFE